MVTGDDALAADPFSWSTTKDGTIRISRGGRHVVTVGGARADRLRGQLDAADEAGEQQLLARDRQLPPRQRTALVSRV